MAINDPSEQTLRGKRKAGRQFRIRAMVMFAIVTASASVGMASAQQAAEPCGWLYSLLTHCQPAALEGGDIVCGGRCPNGATGHISYCRIRVHSTGIAPTVHAVEGWWVIWAPSEQRWYKLFDGRFTAGGFGTTREMHFCNLPCGAYVVGYEWVTLDPFEDPNFTHVSAEVMDAACYDCRTPTPTPWFIQPSPSSTPPTACVWRAFVPHAWRE